MNLMTSNDTPPKVFISYSQDSEAHVDAVLGLANRLRGLGVDVQMDLYVTAPPEGWARWRIDQFVRSDRVLIVCSAGYRAQFEGTAVDTAPAQSLEGLLLLE